MDKFADFSLKTNKRGSGYCFLVALSNGFWPSIWNGFHVFDFYDTFLFSKNTKGIEFILDELSESMHFPLCFHKVKAMFALFHKWFFVTDFCLFSTGCSNEILEHFFQNSIITNLEVLNNLDLKKTCFFISLGSLNCKILRMYWNVKLSVGNNGLIRSSLLNYDSK